MVALSVGCAGGSVEPGRQYTKGESLPRPPVVLVYDFAVDPADVDVDNFFQICSLVNDPPDQRKIVYERANLKEIFAVQVRKSERRYISTENS